MGELDPPNPRSHIAHCVTSQGAERGVDSLIVRPREERPRAPGGIS